MEKIAHITQQVEEGWLNPLEALIELRRIADIVEAAIDYVKPLAVDRATDWKEKTFLYKGVEIRKMDGTRRWSYPDFEPYMIAKTQVKRLEGLMQQVTESGRELCDIVTGEIVPPAKVTYTAPTLALKFPKE
jgi:hypothetical protein